MFVARRRRPERRDVRLQCGHLEAVSDNQAAAALGAKRAKVARQGLGPTRPPTCYKSPHAGCAQCFYDRRWGLSSLLGRGHKRGENASQPHGTGSRTDSEDACPAKSRGIMLREPKTPASNMSPPKALPKGQRDASGAARRRWLGEAPVPRPYSKGILAASHQNVRSSFRSTAEGVNSLRRRSDNAINKPQQR